MNIFENFVPLVALWKPTGREERVTDILVCRITDYSVNVVCSEGMGLYFLDTEGISEIKVGDRFPTGRIVELRKYFYANAEDYRNNILTPSTEIVIRIIPD